MVGWVRVPAEGPAGRPSRCATPRCWTSRARSTRRTCGPRNRPSATRSGEGPRPTSRALPSTASDTSRWTATRAATPDRLTGVVVHSDMRPRAVRDLDPLLNQLQHEHRLGAEGQLPRRADRLPAARRAPRVDRRCAGVHAAPPLSTSTSRPSSPSGCGTSADAQRDGRVPHVVPDVLSPPGKPQAGAAAWADAGVIIPWTMYLSYGDRRILERHIRAWRAGSTSCGGVQERSRLGARLRLRRLARH